jgi:hypothetical protein
MMNPLKLVKSMRGAASPDELFEMLAAVGIDLDFAPIPRGGEPGVIRELAEMPGATFYRLDVKGKNPLSAFVVIGK